MECCFCVRPRMFSPKSQLIEKSNVASKFLAFVEIIIETNNYIIFTISNQNKKKTLKKHFTLTHLQII